MKNEIKYFIYVLCLGMALVAYAHNEFAAKDDVKEMKHDLRDIRMYLMGDRK